MGRRCVLNALLPTAHPHTDVFVSLVVKTGGPCPIPPPGIGALCTLLSYDSAPFLSCGKFPSGVRQGPVIACHLSGPSPRGPCGAGGLLDLPLVPFCRPRAACAASAGRAGGSWFFNSQPLTTRTNLPQGTRPVPFSQRGSVHEFGEGLRIKKNSYRPPGQRRRHKPPGAGHWHQR